MQLRDIAVIRLPWVMCVLRISIIQSFLTCFNQVVLMVLRIKKVLKKVGHLQMMMINLIKEFERVKGFCLRIWYRVGRLT